MSLTEAGQVLGTVAYMSPEQARGSAVDHRTDLWSLGVVAYEMLTGVSPYQAESKTATVGRILCEEPRPLRELRDDVPPALEDLVSSLLRKEAEQRLQSAQEVLQALARSRAPSESRTPAAASRIGRAHLLKRLPVRPLRFRLLAVGIAAAGFALGAGAFLFNARRVTAPAPRRSVAVLGFKNLSGRADTAWLSTALAEMLNTELAAGEKLRTIPGENVALMRSDLSLAEAESYSEQTLARIRNHLGTDLVVLGSYLVLGNEAERQVRLDLRVQDAVGGKTLCSMSEEGTEARLFQVVAHVGARLREKLDVGELSAEQASELGAARPSSPEAARLYAEGLAELRVYDYDAARQLLEKAVAADAGYSLAHSALAEAWGYLGHDAEAQQEARKAFELSEKLSREERLLIEGRYWESQKQWDKAIEIYQSLNTFFPDEVDHGLRLAAAQYSADQAKAARATIERLRKLPAPANDDARIDQQEAWMDLMLSDCKESQIAAASAVTKARAQGALLLGAKARRTEGLAWDCLGEPDKAAAILEEVKGTFVAAGDRRTAATTAYFIGTILAKQGDYSGARRVLQESLATCREIGFGGGISQALGLMARVAFEQGDLAESRKIYEELLASDERDKVGKERVALYQRGLAWVLQIQGHLAEARHLHEEALVVLRESDFKDESVGSLLGLGDLLVAEGDLAAARRHDEEALALAKETGKRTFAARCSLAIARLSLEEAKPAEAEALAREALQESRRQKLVDPEWTARAVLALSLLAQGRPAEAQEQIAGAAEWAQKSQGLGRRLEVLLAAARVRSASGKPEDVGAAVKSLEAVLQEATKAGFVELQLEVRLELGRLELSSGRLAEGRALLDAVTAEAGAKGFGLIVRKAKGERSAME
jgi:eukaryotic-like serine/threonine-protein kinase